MDANTKAWGSTSKGKTLHLFTDAQRHPACNALIDLRRTIELLSYNEAREALTGWWAVADGLKLCTRCSTIYARWAAESAPEERYRELPEGSVLHLSPGREGVRSEIVLTDGNVDDVRRWLTKLLNRPVVPYEVELDDEGEALTRALKIPGVPYRVAHLGDTVVVQPDGAVTVLDPQDAAELEELRAILRRLGGHTA